MTYQLRSGRAKTAGAPAGFRPTALILTIARYNHLLSELVCFSEVCSDEPDLVFFNMLINNCARLRRSN